MLGEGAVAPPPPKRGRRPRSTERKRGSCRISFGLCLLVEVSTFLEDTRLLGELLIVDKSGCVTEENGAEEIKTGSRRVEGISNVANSMDDRGTSFETRL